MILPAEKTGIAGSPAPCDTEPETAVAAAETQAVFANVVAVPPLTNHAETKAG